MSDVENWARVVDAQFDAVERERRETDAKRMLHDYGYPVTPELIAAVAQALMEHVDWPAD